MSIWQTLLFCSALAGCHMNVVKPDAGPPTKPDAQPDADAGALIIGDAAPLPEPGPYATDDNWCPLAQVTLLKLGCKDPYGRLMGAPNADHEEYRDVCRDTEVKQGIPLNAKCQAKAKSCTEVISCTRTKQ
jgi:hypothetical protein